MNEKDIKELLGKSIIKASDDFTDKLMLRLEAKKVTKKSFVSNFTLTFSVLALAILAMSFTLYKYMSDCFTLFDTDFEIDRIPIFVTTTALLLLAINHVLRLNHIYSVFKSNSRSFYNKT
ncbi:hypothetical protein ACOKFD_07885 [Flagellimonas sp. S174]|uniref:hypothetical protein n=1 Tax=Flagellimonas sp. S174 TaxID=3410790 RepID=UPI003BF5176D